MKIGFPVQFCLLVALIACPSGRGQEAARVPVSSATTCTDVPACASPCGGANCFRWTLGLFPRRGCPDDYCAKPYPRQCWPAYLPFYRCVPAGDCVSPSCGGPEKEKLTWWFLPTPQALREALWCHP